MAGIDNASKFRSKEDEERLRRQKAKNPTNINRARELAKQYSNPHKFDNTVTVTRRIDNEKWYAGDKPTARETYARMFQVAGDDQNKMKELQGQYAQEISNPGSVIYNPYAQATNYKAINGLRELGIDVPDVITDQWVDKMWDQYSSHARYTTTGYSPAAPTKTSSREENIAYWTWALSDAKENTNLAESQMKGLYNEVKYLADKGYSDNEIMKHVRDNFGGKYNVLNKMDERRIAGDPDVVRLNRTVNYSGDDTIYGMIWAARNDGGTGDYFTDAVNYAMGNGKKYKADPTSEAALDPTNYEGYDPYSRGSTLHDMNMKYGANAYSREWLEQNRSMLNDPEQAKDWRRISDGVENAEKAEAELAELDKWLEKQIARGKTADEISAELEVIIKNGGDEYSLIKVPTLKAMEDKRYEGDALAMAYGVNFTLPQYIAKANDMIAERDAEKQAAEQEKAAAETSDGEGWFDKIKQWFAGGGVPKSEWGDLQQIKAGLDADNKEFAAKVNPILDAEYGALTTDDMVRNYASKELGVDITGDLTDDERKLVDDSLDTIATAVKMGASSEERAAADAAVEVLQQVVTQIAADPERRTSYEDSEAYNSVINRKPEEPREGMVEMTAEPTAFTGAPTEQVDAENQAYEQAFTQMFQGGEWDFDVFKWAYSVSDNPTVVEAELAEGIKSLMRGEKPASGFAQSWWNKFEGLTANINPAVRRTGLSGGERDVHSQNPEQFDSRHQYGSQVYDALMNNQKAFDVGAINEKAYIRNLILLSDAANEISLAADGGRATDELAAEVLGANNGEYQAILDAVNGLCDEGVAALEAVYQEVRDLTVDTVERYMRGEELSMQESAAIAQIKGLDISDVAKQDSTYQDMLAVFENGLSFDSVIQSEAVEGFTYGSAELDNAHAYDQMMDAGAAAYSIGVSMVARDMLSEDMRFAAACGLTLGEYYEKYPEFSRSGEQILEAAQNEYETTWNEFGKTISGMLEANESLRVETEEGVEKGEDTITLGDVFGLSADTAQRSLDLSMMQGMRFLLYAANSPEEKTQAMRQKYGNDAEAYRADLNELEKKENTRLKGVYDMDATKGDKTFDEWLKEHPEAANYRQFKAQVGSALDIFSIGMTPAEIELNWKIANTGGTIANTSKLVAEHGSAGDGLAYDLLVSGQNSAVTMGATALLGAAGLSTGLASFIATAREYAANADERYQNTGNATAAFWASAAEWVIGSQLERVGFEQYLPDALQGKWANKVSRGVYEMGTKGFGQLIRDPKSMSKVAQSFVGRLITGVGNGAAEWMEEFSQAFVSAMADNYVYGQNILPTGEQISDAVKEGNMAFLMSPAFSAISGNKVTFTDIHGDLLSAAEAMMLPEHDGTILNEAIDFEAAVAAIKSSSEALAQIENSTENAAKQQTAADLQAANAELAESQAELTAAQEAESAAAVALEDANVEMQDGGVFTEDLRKRMTAAADAIQKAKERVAKVKERVSAAAEKQAEAQQRHEEAKAKVQAMYDAVMEEAKAKARQIVTDLFFGGDSEAQQAASQKYLDACERLMDAKNRLRSAKADAEMYARGTPKGDDAHTAYGEALLEVDALTEEVAAAKAEVDAAYAEAHIGEVEAMQSEELTTAAQAAEQARAEADADPMNAKKQAKAELEESKLRTLRAKQTMDDKRHGISQRLTDPRGNVREQAVSEWNALQAEADAAVAENEALQAEYDKTDAQKQLADAVEEAKGYTKEQVLFADEPGHVQAVRARNKLALAKADVEVENALKAIDDAEVGTSEYDAAMAAYNTAVEAREDEVGRQMGVTGDTVRGMLNKSPLGEQVMDAIKQGNQNRVASLIEQVLNSSPERKAELIKQTVKKFLPFKRKHSLNSYSDRQKANWATSKRIVLYENDAQLQSFVEDAEHGKNLDKKMYFGAVSKDLADDIARDTGLNVEGFNCSLAAQEVRKIEKSHGDEKRESERGQRPIKKEDFLLIPTVIQDFDTVSKSPNEYNGKPAILFEKEIDGSKITVCGVVSDKRMDLFVQTMYASKKRSLATVTDEQASVDTPKATSGTAPTAIIAQDASGVNTPVENNFNQNREIANDLAGQLMNNTDNAMEIADILGRISGDMWRDHRTPARTGEQTTADRNPIEILSDLTRSIRVGYNPGGTVSVDGERVPRAVLGVYERLARSITTRTSDAGDLELGLHEFGHAVHDRLTGLQANDRLMDSLSQDVRDAYDRPQWEGEAIAEFVIDYIFSRDAAINLAGDDFVREFETMLRQDRDLYNAVMDASHQVELWNNADPGSRMDAMVKNYTVDPRRREIGSWLSRQLRGLDTGIFDYTAPAKLVSRDFHRQALYNAHARKRSDTVLNQRLIDPSGREIGQSLAERLYEAGVGEADMPAIVRFALARHALDRRIQNRDVFTPREFSTADLESIVAEYAGTNIEAGANALTSFWNDFMDAWMVDTGLIDRATIENMRAMYPHYVPTFRVVGENFNNFGGRQSTFRLREAVEGGSSLEVINPMISMVDQVQKVVNTVTNNQMMRAFHREMQRGGMGDIARLVPEREAVRHTDINRAMAAFNTVVQGGNADPDAVENMVRELAALEQQFIATGQGAGRNVVSGVDEYGNRFFYEIYDKPLFYLLSGSVHTASSVPEAVRRFKNTFTALTTGSNPLFALKNAQRDFQASVNTGTWALTYADGMAKWIWALTEVFANSESYQQWKSMGGGSHSRFQSAMIEEADAGRLAREVSSALLRGRRTLTGQFRVNDTALERISQVITLEKLNTAIEDASRFAEWRFGRHDLSTDEGRMEAFMRSQDVTTNFGTHGAYGWIQVLNKIVPFMNATLQGTSKDIHIVADIFGTDNAARAEALPKAGKIIMNTALTAAFQMAILKSFAKGDEDDEDYALLSGAMKAGNLIIPIPQSVRESLQEFSGFNKPYIRVPIAQGVLHQGMYAVLLNCFGNVADYSPLEMDLMTTVMQIMAESVPTDGTIFQAFMDAKNNRTWYGKQIENSYMQSGSEYNRTKAGTSKVVTKLARALLMSPAKLDYVLNQYSGVIGKVAAPLLSGEGTRGLLNNVLSAYAVDPVTTNDLSDNFNSAKTLLSQTVTDGKRGDPLGNLAYGIDANAAFEEALYLDKYFEAANKEANALWAEYNEIKDSAGMSKGEQARAMRSIRQEINDVYADALAEFDSFKMQYVNRDWLAIETTKELFGFATKASVN